MIIEDVQETDFEKIEVDAFWNIGDEKEHRMHRLHSYPAKFPAFITTKAIMYAEEAGIEVNTIADIFCGCGTVAYEAKRHNLDFWGCDINPVATLIAKSKSGQYTPEKIAKYMDEIIAVYENISQEDIDYAAANERIRYWFKEKQFRNLTALKQAIKDCTPKRSRYRNLFLCAFSNILKPTSVWLAKSIKPTIDKNKVPRDVLAAFRAQCKSILRACNDDLKSDSKIQIETTDVLSKDESRPVVDMIVTSPPYVTSYEYADLHQLSSLWLDMTEDFRELREGTIGSQYHQSNFEDCMSSLNESGSKIVFQLYNHDKAKAKSVAKYYLDMQEVAKVSFNMLENGGLALFVIGDTEYKGIKIENARHLVESLEGAGFESISVTKRKISNKFLTPYRDSNGRFTNDKTSRKIYSEEFIVVGRK